MKNISSSNIRKSFIDFFVSKNHTNIPSSSIIPADPSLLFTNSGMVPFKAVFLNQEQPSYTRATSAQRCIRAGGKHNDLENVGFTARHHTFFEMLGNFSFGDYFKEEAISFAWEYLTKILEIPVEKLWITVFESDDDAFNIWNKKIGVPSEKIIRLGNKSNFWQMADVGPCGPCSEIFYDHGEGVSGGLPGSPDEDGDRYTEIWNIVFMQHERSTDGQLHSLQKPCIDTGMGLERIAAAIQGFHNNYETDIFMPIINTIEPMMTSKASDWITSARVIADHIRACIFLINDEVFPSNESHGYVLRRIIRRALRHGHKQGIQTGFFNKLVNPLIEIMQDGHPDIVAKRKIFIETLEVEENKFNHTLSNGMDILNAYFAKSTTKIIDGKTAFQLYDTYGFPLDLTQTIAQEKSFKVDTSGFESLMTRQREMAKNAQSFVRLNDVRIPENTNASQFVGYEKTCHEAKILAILEKNQETYKAVDDLSNNGILILDSTTFYAESGGQIADSGCICSDEAEFSVTNVQRQGDHILHYGIVTKGKISCSQNVKTCVDTTARNAIRKNHSAVHLLHAALGKILGEHVIQRGSLVTADYLRFDFTHPKAMTSEQISQVQDLVIEQIKQENQASTKTMAIDEAKKMGAKALFSEKYSEQVRVLSISQKNSEEPFSIELCGGTHVENTSEIEYFQITSEGSVASGVRRIEAITSKKAVEYYKERSETLEKVREELGTQEGSVLKKIEKILEENTEQKKRIEQLEMQYAKSQVPEILRKSSIFGSTNVLIHTLEANTNIAIARTLLESLRNELNGAVILIQKNNCDNNKNVSAKIFCGTASCCAINAKELMMLSNNIAGGKGGGSPIFAQGTIDNADLVNEISNALKQKLEQVI